MRVTQKRLQDMVQSINWALGNPLQGWSKNKKGKLRANIGHIQLDHNSIYGGYVLTQIMNESGGEDFPFGFGCERVSGKVMYNKLAGIIAGLRAHPANDKLRKQA